MWRIENRTFYSAVEKHRLMILADESDYSTETSRAVGRAGKFAEQFGIVGCVVVAGAGISGAVNTRGAAESVYFEAGVIGNAVEAVALEHPLRFCKGVAFESVGVFGNVVVAADVG